MKKLNLRSFSKRVATVGAIGIMAISALIPATAFAASNTPAKCAAKDVACVITAGNTLITDRLTSLNTLSSKVSTDLTAKKITSDQANALQSDVTTNQTGLTNLKTKLDAETTESAARADVTNVFLQFRIYAVVLPRDYRTIEMDVERNAKGVMQDVAPTIKTAIGKAPASQQAQLNSLFSDYQAQVAAAETQLDTAQNDFPAMTPENFNQNKTTYESTRTNLDNALKAARGDLHQAAKDLHEMAHILGIKA
jgi:hypothetical protein